MAEATPASARPRLRPGEHMRLIDALQYRLPLAGLLSILHRASGLILAALLPLVIWLFDKSVSSEVSYESFTAAFASGLGVFPGWFIKLVVLALIWSFLHHLMAGLRHLWMDTTHSTSKAQGRSSAVLVFALSIALTLLLGAKLFGLF